MTSQYNTPQMTDRERARHGIAKAQYAAFEAVHRLWERRQKEGKRQVDIAEFVGQNPSTVSRNLGGPANWTLKTLGQYVEALNGELEVIVHAMEDPIEQPVNYDAYQEVDLALGSLRGYGQEKRKIQNLGRSPTTKTSTPNRPKQSFEFKKVG